MVNFRPGPGVRPARTKFIRGATSAATIPSNTGGLHSSMSSKWRQVDLINPTDSNLTVVAGLAEHTTTDFYECDFWYNQLALILSGEMIIQDLDTGEVYKGHEGDLFYWAPGHRHRHGGMFRAFFIKSPVPTRWVSTPDGKRGFDVLYLEKELTYPGTPPDKIRKDKAGPGLGPKRKRMKFIRGATSIKPGDVEGSDKHAIPWGQVDIVNATDSDFALVAGIADYPGELTRDCDHRWHQVALILDGEVTNEDLETGEVYRGRKGDLFYWPPGLRHRLTGRFRAYYVQTPISRRLLATPQGMEMLNLVAIQNERLYPSSPPDEIRQEPLR